MNTNDMRTVVWLVVLAACLLLGTLARSADVPFLQSGEAARSCADLVQVDLTAIGGPGSKVTSADENVTTTGRLCAVSGNLAPTIGFKVTLPSENWNQRFLQVGCGGLCGRVSLDVGAADGCVPLEQGTFAIAGTDMGHEGMGGDFGNDPQKRVDFAYRGVHLTALAAKRIITAYYGRAPAYSYFNGCSDGGREAVMEAQRFPEDFDGIIAGAAAMSFQTQNSIYHAWQAASNTGTDGKAILVAPRLPILHKAVIAKCDGLDGHADGLVSNPFACNFDPASIQCADANEASTCLTAAEVGVAKKFYDGPKDAATGLRLTVGGPLPGSELAWQGVYVPGAADQPFMSQSASLDALKGLSFPANPPASFTLADMTFDVATFDKLRALHPLYDATNPDISRFAQKGGKLILWHGLADPHITPKSTITYHQAIRVFFGDARAEEFERLYLLPGVYHCGGGEGPSMLDLLTPMMQWVEQGKAPDAILTMQPSENAQSNFGQPNENAQSQAPAAPATIVRKRPVYPYPAMAAYDGRGDATEATSYSRGPPMQTPDLPEWAGSDFYRPYQPLIR